MTKTDFDIRDYGAKERPFEGFSFSDCRFARDSSAAGPLRGADKTPQQEFVLRNCRGFTFDRTTFDDWAANRHSAEWCDRIVVSR